MSTTQKMRSKCPTGSALIGWHSILSLGPQRCPGFLCPVSHFKIEKIRNAFANLTFDLNPHIYRRSYLLAHTLRYANLVLHAGQELKIDGILSVRKKGRKESWHFIAYQNINKTKDRSVKTASAMNKIVNKRQKLTCYRCCNLWIEICIFLYRCFRLFSQVIPRSIIRRNNKTTNLLFFDNTLNIHWGHFYCHIKLQNTINKSKMHFP